MAGSGGNRSGETTISDLTRVRFSNLDKIMYPSMQITKKEVIAYYIRVAPRMLPFLSDRPVTMHRFPGGVGGEDFYEKDAPQGTPGLCPSVYPFFRNCRSRSEFCRVQQSGYADLACKPRLSRNSSHPFKNRILSSPRTSSFSISTRNPRLGLMR